MPALDAARIDRPLTSTGRLSAMRAVVEMFHFPPILMVLLACGIFSILAADGSPPAGRIVIYLAAVLCSQMAIGVHNDFCDRALDAVAKPTRAIPRDVISPKLALEVVCALLALSLALALPLGANVAALGVLGTAMGFLYNARLKGSIWAWLPFWVALPTLVIASFAVVDAYRSELLLTYVIGLPLVIPIYIADTLIDIESDRAQGVLSLATRLGPMGARLLCWGSLVVGYVLAIVFWPENGSPGLLFGVSIGLLVVAIVSDTIRVPRVHWLAIFLAVIALAADWLLDVRNLPG